MGLEFTLMWTVAALYFLVHGGGAISVDHLLSPSPARKWGLMRAYVELLVERILASAILRRDRNLGLHT
jgi:hypothetical protein